MSTRTRKSASDGGGDSLPSLDALEAAGDISATAIPDPEGAADALDTPEPAEDTPKRRRGRKPGSRNKRRSRTESEPAPDAAPPVMSPEQVNQLAAGLAQSLNFATELAGEIYGPSWRLKSEQCAQLGSIWAPILAPYLPAMGAAAPVLMAVLQTGMVVAPNIIEARRAKVLVGDIADAPPAAPAEGGESV